MPKLHELLAIEASLESESKGMMKAAEATFSNPNAFTGFHITYQSIAEDSEGNADVVIPEERKGVSAAVGGYLSAATDAYFKWLGVNVSKETANTMAKADLVVGGVTVAKDVPATALLSLETKLKGVVSLVESIPTNELGVDWQVDDTHAIDGVYAAPATETIRQEQVPEVLVMAEATEHHPAQVQLVKKQVPVARKRHIAYSAMMQPNDKREMVQRAKDMLLAVKQARQRANQQVVIETDVVQSIRDYIFD